jgi:hypothetical protein
VPFISAFGVAFSLTVVSDVAVLTVAGVARTGEAAPVPQAANKKSERRSAEESIANGIGNDWLCLLMCIFLYWQASSMQKKLPDLLFWRMFDQGGLISTYAPYAQEWSGFYLVFAHI